jgi:hypothetical protein
MNKATKKKVKKFIIEKIKKKKGKKIKLKFSRYIFINYLERKIFNSFFIFIQINIF